MNNTITNSLQKMIDVNTPIIYIQDYDFVRVDEIIANVVKNQKVFEWNPATGTTNFKTKEGQGFNDVQTLDSFLNEKYIFTEYSRKKPIFPFFTMILT